MTQQYLYSIWGIQQSMHYTWSNLKQITNQNKRKKLFSSDAKQLENTWKLREGIPGIFWNQ